MHLKVGKWYFYQFARETRKQSMFLCKLAGASIMLAGRELLFLPFFQKFIVLAERGVARGSERPSLSAAGSERPSLSAAGSEYHSVTSR
ncbi:hypothetical protein P8452_26220 [Trifolium repens]|nr:hypothetical protein P8452_26220 [Trifolium repens]